MNPSEAIRFLLLKNNILNNPDPTIASNASIFLQHIEMVERTLNRETFTSIIPSSPSTIFSIDAPSTSHVDLTVETIRKYVEEYDKLIQGCTEIANNFVTQADYQSQPPPLQPQIEGMLKLHQKTSKKALEVFKSKLTLKNDGKISFDQLNDKQKIEFNEFLNHSNIQYESTVSLMSMVSNWVKNSILIDCRVYCSNESGEIQGFGCHSVLLKQYSTKLKCDLETSAFQKDDKNILQIPLFEYPANVVESFLIGCYGGPLSNHQGVYLMAKQLRSLPFMNFAIREMKLTLAIESIFMQYKFAYENDILELMDECIEFWKRNFSALNFKEFAKVLPENIYHEFCMNISMDPLAHLLRTP